MKTSLPVPLKDVSFGDQAGAFVARGDDPQMLWTPQRGNPQLSNLSAFRLTVCMTPIEGEISEPCIYADWGDGFSEETETRLSIVSDGVYRGVSYTNAGGLRRLRFDPSCGPCAFVVESFEIEEVGDGGPPAIRISPVRRWARVMLRRLPQSTQTTIRRVAAQMRALMMGDAGGLKVVWTPPSAWRENYTRAFEVARNLRSPDFAAPPLAPPRRQIDGPRVLAFYLPQFHPIAENNAWWSPGFTEWTNVSKATPQFTGHLQPRLPADLGFYDLRVPEVRKQQVQLAKTIGVDGFCFHYYWFGGKRLLEQPLDDFVNDPDLDFPFALCWANENWTRRWDGQEADILIGQKHSPEDDAAVLGDLARYIRSPRYIRVGGRPLILVYRPDALPDARATVERWRTHARALGLGELFVACTNAFGFSDFRGYGFDALVDFPPHAVSVGEITNAVELLNPNFTGKVYDYAAVVGAKVKTLLASKDARRIPGVMPGWDNEARKPGGGNVFQNASPELFHTWVSAALNAAKQVQRPDERLVFVNAWNEWAEGAYLEPDRWHGHAFGQALRSAIEDGAPRTSAKEGRDDVVLAKGGRSKAVVLLHLYYADLIAEFATRLKPMGKWADLSISFPDVWTADEVAALSAAFPKARLVAEPNIGRDLAPFISALRWADAQGYEVFCKIHSKRSPHMTGGDAWRDALLSPLLKNAGSVIEKFQADSALGLIADENAHKRLGEDGVMHNNAAAFALLGKKLGFTYDNDTAFPAGTMFWGKTAAFKSLTTAEDLPFELELGRIDGTLAHALERAMGAIVTASGHRVEWNCGLDG